MIQKPLAEELRPKYLKDFIGQEHLVGKNGPIKKAVLNKSIYSMIFWGSPGCGKTTLARIIANELDCTFEEISPTTSGVKDIKAIVEKAKSFLSTKNTILFVDEIHRFNKAQQDYLLPHVENGTITLIGATTENPSFEVVSALLSRVSVYVFKPLEKKDIKVLINRAVKYLNSNKINYKLSNKPLNFLINTSNGDARSVLNTISSCVKTNNLSPTVEDLQNVMQNSYLNYDKKGEEHYNTISAFIKSMRSSNVDAALYYLAKMVKGGEDPKFIARRMVIFASEDIGIANNTAVVVANEVFRAVETIGYPECQINLAHGATYLALSKKSRKSYDAYFAALRDIERYGNLPTPPYLRNAPTKLMKDLGYGKDYKMYKDTKSFLPKKLEGRVYFD